MDQWQQRYPGAVGPGIRQAGGQGMNPGAGAMGGTPNVQAAAQAAAAQVNKLYINKYPAENAEIFKHNNKTRISVQ